MVLANSLIGRGRYKIRATPPFLKILLDAMIYLRFTFSCVGEKLQ